MFLACPKCKYIWISWKGGDVVFNNHVFMSMPVTCPMCYAAMKIVSGRLPECCHHGRPLHINCGVCKRDEKNMIIK